MGWVLLVWVRSLPYRSQIIVNMVTTMITILNYLPLYGAGSTSSLLLTAATGLMAKEAFDMHRLVEKQGLCPPQALSFNPWLGYRDSQLTAGVTLSW